MKPFSFFLLMCAMGWLCFVMGIEHTETAFRNKQAASDAALRKEIANLESKMLRVQSALAQAQAAAQPSPASSSGTGGGYRAVYYGQPGAGGYWDVRPTYGRRPVSAMNRIGGGM
jgi:hypothetical protein